MGRINELSPEQIKNEIMSHAGLSFWQIYKNFIPSSLEVFWNGQKLIPNDDFYIVDEQTIDLIGARSIFDNDDIVKRDIITCNYLVKI